MTTGLQPYPEYKDSGLPWLGGVPAHWEIRRIKTLLREVDRRSTTGDEVLLSMTRQRGLIRHADATEKMHSATTLIGYKICRGGEVVMNRMQAWSGMFHVAPKDGLVSPDYAVFAPLGDVCPLFLGHLLRSPQMVAKFHAESKGIGSGFLRLYGDRFGAIHASLPPQDEQQTIVRFVRDLDKKVNRFIRNRRRLIEVLNEQKQAIINRAVTRGLDPNAPLKPSGIDWLGDIPEHWDVRRIKSLSQVRRGASPRPIHDARYFDDSGEFAWVRIADVTASERYLERTIQRLSRLGQSKSVEMLPGSLFLSIAGSVGKPIITKIKCCIHDGFVYFPQFHGNTEFLYYVFASGRLYGGLGKLGTQLNLNTDTVGAISIAWPPNDEQAKIVEYLDEALGELNRGTAIAKREIDLIREYRTRLIADVVTGKVDIRNVKCEGGSGNEEAFEEEDEVEEEIVAVEDGDDE